MLNSIVFEDTEQTRQAKLLFAVQTFSFLFVFAIAAAAAVLLPAGAARASVAVASFAVLGLLSYLLVRAGKVQLASAIYLLASWLIIVLLCITGGGTKALAFNALAMVVLGAGLLLGVRGGIAAVVICAITAIALGYAEQLGMLPPPVFRNTTTGLVVGQVFFFGWIAVFVFFYASGIRRAGEALRNSEAQLRFFSEATSEGIVISANGLILETNQQGARIFGLERSEMIGRPIADFAGEESREKIARNIRLGVSEPYAAVGVRKDGSRFPAELQGRPSTYLGRPCRVTVLRDLTERAAAEKQLLLLAHAVRSISECVSVTDMEDRLLFVNEAFARTYGYTQDELLGRSMSLFWSTRNDPTVLQNILPATLQGGWRGELWNRRKDGSEFPIDLSTSVIHDDEGCPRALVGVATDITERRHAEAQIRESLREKDLLLKEVHHRVKNNLQMVISLLNLQAQRLTDASMKDVLVESQNRVRSIALMHELLYKSDRFGTVDFVDYCRKLGDQLLRTFKVGDVQLEVAGETTTLDLDKAIPCGLILSELVTNALKHAFRDGRKGWIRIHPGVDQGEAYLVVSDDGAGLADEARTGQPTSLGIRLVTSLTEQLEGKLDVTTAPGAGTTFTVRFPLGASTKKKPTQGGPVAH